MAEEKMTIIRGNITTGQEVEEFEMEVWISISQPKKAWGNLFHEEERENYVSFLGEVQKFKSFFPLTFPYV